VARKNELVIHISREGRVSLEVDGLAGPSCLELTRGLEECLGNVAERKKKPAFHTDVSLAAGISVQEELSGAAIDSAIGNTLGGVSGRTDP
jgi:hypothetical protein